MIIIVGLGNPGKKYEKTRHNLGFQIVNEFLKKNRNVYLFSDFKFEKKYKAQISKGKIDGEKIILVKPQTFMNNSGKVVKLLIKNLKLKIKNLIVIHDDIDLPLGKIKVMTNRGAAGHKGIESIIQEVKSKDFIRFRIGIQPKIGKPKNPANFVLQKFNKEEEKIIKEVIEKTIEVIKFYLKEGLEKTMTNFNK